VPRDELLHECVKQLLLASGQHALFDQNLAERLRLVAHPIVEGPHKLSAVDQVVFQGEQTKKKVPIRGLRHIDTPCVGRIHAAASIARLRW
jgi:hypothetical protein